MEYFDSERLMQLFEVEDRTTLEKDVAYLLDYIDFATKHNLDEHEKLTKEIEKGLLKEDELNDKINDLKGLIHRMAHTIKVMKAITINQAELIPRFIREDPKFKPMFEHFMNIKVPDYESMCD